MTSEQPDPPQGKKSGLHLPKVSGKKLLGHLLWVLLGAFLEAVFHEPVSAVLHSFRAPDRLLAQADSTRHLLTERDLRVSVSMYNQLMDKYPNWSSRAHLGLSRAYADLAMIRFWKGLTGDRYAKLARSEALVSDRLSPGNQATGVALGYAAASIEAGSHPKQATRAKAEELESSGQRGLDVAYLAWIAAPRAAKDSFPAHISPDTVDDLRILLDLGGYYSILAEGEDTTSGSRVYHLSRADTILSKASQIAPDNPFVWYALGYLESVRPNEVLALQYYEKAADRDPNFPRAHNNLGTLYQSAGDYKAARNQYAEAVSSADAESHSKLTWLVNLGEQEYEIGDSLAACGWWHLSTTMEGAAESWLSHYAQAMCSYITGSREVGAEHFRIATQYAKASNLDLTSVDTFTKRGKTGPRVTRLAMNLIRHSHGAAKKN